MAQRLGIAMSDHFGRIEMVANTGTFIDAPYHFHAEAPTWQSSHWIGWRTCWSCEPASPLTLPPSRAASRRWASRATTRTRSTPSSTLFEAELARLIQENTDLRTRVEPHDQQQFAAPVHTGGDLRRLESLGPPSPPPLPEQTAPGGDHNVHAARVLGLAQEMADRLTSEAKAEADGMLSHARIKFKQLLSEA